MSKQKTMNGPYIVVRVSTSVDGRVALGPNRTWWDDLADPRCKTPDS
jgi:hypothetical protein